MIIPEQAIKAAIDHVLKEEVEKEVKALVEQARERLEKRIPEMVAGLALRVQKNFSVERLGETLHIRVSLGGELR